MLPMMLLLVLCLSVPGSAQTYQVIHSFSDGIGGNSPWSEITIGPGGHMYGTTLFGGDNHDFYCYYGCGIVYEIYQRNGSWIFTTLHEFLIQEGANPHSGVVIGPDGALYGAASEGGLQESDCDLAGCGTVYKLQPPATPPPTPLTFWNLTGLYEFTGGDHDGASSSGLAGIRPGTCTAPTVAGRTIAAWCISSAATANIGPSPISTAAFTARMATRALSRAACWWIARAICMASRAPADT